MKRLFALCTVVSLALLIACAPAEEKAETPAVKTYTMEQFLKTVTVNGGSFNPDETKLLVTTNESGIFNAAVIDIASGERTALTTSTGDNIFAIAYMPNDERVLYSSDKGGNEINHLYLLGTDGSVTELTQGENTKEQFYGFAPDYQSFFTGNNSRDPKFFDVYEWDVATLQPTLFYRNETGMNLAAISPDKRWVALTKTNTSDDNDMYLLDRSKRNAKPVMLNPTEGNVRFSPETFSPDSTLLYYTTDLDNEFMYLRSYNVTTGETADVFKSNWDVAFVTFSDSGAWRVIGTNEDGIYKLNIVNTATGEELKLPELPAGEMLGFAFSRSEKNLRFYLGNDNAPSNLYIYAMETGDLKQLTNNLNPEINADDLVKSELIRYAARDGMEIPGFLYKPKTASAENKVPCLLWIHGGPGGQSTPNYSAERQFLINHGYAIFAVNNRGSSGYGKSFYTADDQKHGKEPLWDCVDAKNWLKENVDWVDPEKIGIMGGSYGGYMVMAALAFEPEEFAVGVNLFGVTNWLRTLQSIPSWWESFRLSLYQEIGDPNTQEQMLREISPLFHADRITKPVMVLQGVNDPRVIKAESDDIVKAIQDKGGIVEYVLFDDEGHGFTKTANRIKGFNAVLAFLDKHLKGAGGDDAAK